MMEIITLLLKLIALLLIGATSVCGFIYSWRSWKPKSASLQTKVICVVGGGFGGLYSALYIAAKSDNLTEVLLIEPKDNFAFSPLYYELTLGSADVAEVVPAYDNLLTNTKLKLIRGYVDAVDASHSSCNIVPVCTSGRGEHTTSIRFDELIIATGIVPCVDSMVGAKEHALPYYSAENALKLRDKLKRLKETVIGVIQVVVIGGGCGGVEVAANIAEHLGAKARITIVDHNTKLMTTSSDFNRRTSERTLRQRGVHLRLSTSVRGVTATAVSLTDRLTNETSTISAHIVILTAGTQQTPLVASLNVPKNPQGRIITRPTLQCIENDHIYALGDCAAVRNAENPATAQVAMQQALTVAHNVLESIRHSRLHGDAAEVAADKKSTSKTQTKSDNMCTLPQPRLQEFHFLNLGEMISLGDSHAAMTSLGGWVKISGPLAALARRLVYIVRMPTLWQSWVALKSAASCAWKKTSF